MSSTIAKKKCKKLFLVIKKNEIASYFGIKKKTVKKNKVTSHSGIKLEMESTNNDL